MKNKPLIIAIIVASILVVGGVVAMMAMRSNDSTNGDHSSDMPATQQSTTSENESQTSQATNEVAIENYTFNPVAITVKKGTTVTWTNKDMAEHNVEFDEQPATGDKEGPLLAQGETYSFTFDTVGTFTYICSPHPYMKGTVVVTE